MWGVNSRSGSVPDPYLGCTFYLNLGSIVVQALVPSMSHLCWLWGGRATPDMDPAPDPYLCCLENWTFCPIFLFTSILIVLCLHKPYISLFKCNFGSLEWQKLNWYVFLFNIIGQFLFLLWTLFFFTFSCVCQIYVSEVLIIHFSDYYHLRFVSPYEYQIEVSFWGVNSGSWSNSRSIFGLYF